MQVKIQTNDIQKCKKSEIINSKYTNIMNKNNVSYMLTSQSALHAVIRLVC